MFLHHLKHDISFALKLKETFYLHPLKGDLSSMLKPEGFSRKSPGLSHEIPP